MEDPNVILFYWENLIVFQASSAFSSAVKRNASTCQRLPLPKLREDFAVGCSLQEKETFVVFSLQGQHQSFEQVMVTCIHRYMMYF